MAIYLVAKSIKSYDPEMTVVDVRSISIEKVFFPCLTLAFYNDGTGRFENKYARFLTRSELGENIKFTLSGIGYLEKVPLFHDKLPSFP